ncbi:YmaF family protein [Paenibacillus terreus]|uniref:YmaF family protein n=1 Tax=Paenibacillus terreus TaxID=1387834 RepID=UPI0035CCCC4D
MITSWDGRPVNMHVHPMAGKTSFDVGHYHQYAGTTEPAPTGIPHVHHYNIETTFNDQHVHLLKGTTGPAVPLPSGGHYHYFEGYTTVNGRIPHTHSYQGRTGNEV